MELDLGKEEEGKKLSRDLGEEMAWERKQWTTVGIPQGYQNLLPKTPKLERKPTRE